MGTRGRETTRSTQHMHIRDTVRTSTKVKTRNTLHSTQIFAMNKTKGHRDPYYIRRYIHRKPDFWVTETTLDCLMEMPIMLLPEKLLTDPCIAMPSL